MLRLRAVRVCSMVRVSMIIRARVMLAHYLS